MSNRYTFVEIPGCSGYGIDGHVGATDALIEARAHWARQRREAEAALDAIDNGGASVYHQRGVVVARERRLVLGPAVEPQDKTQQP